MSLDVAYRSDASEVLDVWDETTRRYKAYSEACSAFEAEFPEFALLQRGSGDRRYICGLRHREGGADGPGHGWRYQSTMDGWVPDRRVKAGKEFDRRFRDELKVNGLAVFPGMPSNVMVPGHWYSHGTFEYKRVVYVNWAAEPAKVVEEQEEFDGTLWQRIPLSEYHAAHEAAEAAQASTGA